MGLLLLGEEELEEGDLAAVEVVVEVVVVVFKVELLLARSFSCSEEEKAVGDSLC